ncbi:hypothetical protein IVB57_40170 [Bradyrhizobium sp. CW9]|uniref:phage integrase central domain-containing protein n=1 Tax=Bradyrhizobium sp. CW9 TaxID=2782689 RepID=UPI001FF8E629|nr:hypothetical protein [Bradyrhizobium sp. CW9]MCK1334382.1 hypothetical protein [Bradyrhizobium sp. CW9]
MLPTDHADLGSAVSDILARPKMPGKYVDGGGPRRQIAHRDLQARCWTSCLKTTGTMAAQARNAIPQQHDHLREVAVRRGGRRIDFVVVVKVIKVEWKSAPQTMDRVRQRIGEVLRFAEVRSFRKPGPLPTR